MYHGKFDSNTLKPNIYIYIYIYTVYVSVYVTVDLQKVYETIEN